MKTYLCVINQIRVAGGGIGVNQRRRQSSATTANVDIEVPAAIMTGSGEKKLPNFILSNLGIRNA